MRNFPISIFVCTFLLLSLSSCGEQTKEQNSKPSVSINPVDSYVDSRLNAIDSAKDAVKESNRQAEAQNRAVEALIK